MNKKDSVPHKENATRMNIQLKKKKKFQACRKQENMTLKEEKKTYIYIYQLKPTQNQHRC